MKKKICTVLHFCMALKQFSKTDITAIASFLKLYISGKEMKIQSEALNNTTQEKIKSKGNRTSASALHAGRFQKDNHQKIGH